MLTPPLRRWPRLEQPVGACRPGEPASVGGVGEGGERPGLGAVQLDLAVGKPVGARAHQLESDFRIGASRAPGSGSRRPSGSV